jgi:hypothetical protein
MHSAGVFTFSGGLQFSLGATYARGFKKMGGLFIWQVRSARPAMGLYMICTRRAYFRLGEKSR